jgi:predicted peptidase
MFYDRCCIILPMTTERITRAFPDVLAAAVPVAGGGNPDAACGFSHVPIWAFHGELDQLVPEMRSAEMIHALRACGGTPSYTVVAGEGHGIEGSVYSNPNLYDWLLAQNLTDIGRRPNHPLNWTP